MKLNVRVRTLLLIAVVVAVLMSLALRESQKVFPPDIVSVEVASALPGRPITGSRLVMPDGKMSLGYYGKVEVAGLTPHEIGRAVAIHLRHYFPADAKGISIDVVKVNSRRPNLVDWLTGKVRFKDVKTLL